MSKTKQSNTINSGVYCIINKKNGMKYVGSSKNVTTRLKSHKSSLKRHDHCNSLIQQDWDQDNSCFDFNIMINCDYAEALKLEQILIESGDYQYNIRGSDEYNKKTQKTKDYKINNIKQFINKHCPNIPDHTVYLYPFSEFLRYMDEDISSMISFLGRRKEQSFDALWRNIGNKTVGLFYGMEGHYFAITNKITKNIDDIDFDLKIKHCCDLSLEESWEDVNYEKWRIVSNEQLYSIRR